MALKDLTGKTALDLEQEDFERLFCQQCKDCGICVKGLETVKICRGLIDNGAWDGHFSKRRE